MNQNRECWLKNELNDSFRFIKKEVYEGVEFEVYLDDYGQSYHGRQGHRQDQDSD